ASTPADLTLSIIQSPSGPIGLGETVEFTYTMRNIGGTDVNAEMLGGITGAASSSIKTQPDGLQTPCTQARIQLQCTDFILAAGATKTLVVQARASTTLPGAITANGTIDLADNVGDPNPGNNSDSVSISVIRLPDLTVSIVDGPDLVQAGAHVQFKVN